ncbi:hypothetical protein PENTCL1PPCAC_203, partial [Pristionchus entomophagus]
CRRINSIPHPQATHTPWLRHQSTIIRFFPRRTSSPQPSRSSPPSCTTDSVPLAGASGACAARVLPADCATCATSSTASSSCSSRIRSCSTCSSRQRSPPSSPSRRSPRSTRPSALYSSRDLPTYRNPPIIRLP